jgi:hypothetical protein
MLDIVVIHAMPPANVRPRRRIGVSAPFSARSPSDAAATSIQACVTISSRRRSTTSASVPDGRASTKNGRLVAVCIIDTSVGDGARIVIVHAAAVSCIHVPTFETTAAIQSARNVDRRSGVQMSCSATRREPVFRTAGAG